jgi:hypothetical protein
MGERSCRPPLGPRSGLGHLAASTRVAARALLLTVTALVLSASPAAADPAVPTNYRAEITAIDPRPAGVEVRAEGGDAFLVVEAEPGVEVLILGYGPPEEEPYVRIGADGTIEANVNSPAFYLNDERYGDTDVPDEASPTAEPVWEPVGTGHRYAWHDHRIHWMSPEPPPPVQRAPGEEQTILSWSVPIVVNGETVQIIGETTWYPSTSPLAPLAAGLLAAALVAAAARGLGRPAVGAGLVAATVLAAVVSAGTVAGAVIDRGPVIVELGVAVLALAGAGAALFLSRRRPDEADRITIGAGAFLLIWGGLRFDAMTAPIFPSPLPGPFIRLAIAAALGAALAAVVTTVRARSAPGTPAERDTGGDRTTGEGT